MSYRDDLAALEAYVHSVRREAQAKLDELDRANQLADEARQLVRRRVLEATLATPCAARWDEMEGNLRVRHCGRCNKHVYNVGELTRQELDALVVKHEGKLCMRFFVRGDGTLITKDCKRDVRIRPSRLAVALGAAAIAAGAAAGMGGALVDAYRAPPGFATFDDVGTEYAGGMQFDEGDEVDAR